jgi:hypothetical protein
MANTFLIYNFHYLKWYVFTKKKVKVSHWSCAAVLNDLHLESDVVFTVQYAKTGYI